jgi:hypothetical protein
MSLPGKRDLEDEHIPRNIMVDLGDEHAPGNMVTLKMSASWGTW